MTRLRNIWRDQRGNGVVELGLTFPIFMLLVGGLVETSRAYSIKVETEQAAQRAVEWIQASDFKFEDIPTIRADAATAAGVAQSAVTVDAWLQCGGARQSDYNGTCNPGVTMERFVTVAVTRNYQPWINTHEFQFYGLNAKGQLPITATAGVRVQ